MSNAAPVMIAIPIGRIQVSPNRSFLSVCRAVDRRVDLAIPAAVQPVAVGIAGADRDRRHVSRSGELGIGYEPLRAGDLADELGRGSGPNPGSESDCGALSATS